MVKAKHNREDGKMKENTTKLMRKRTPTREESLYLAARLDYPLLSGYHRRNLTREERRRYMREYELSRCQQWERETFGKVLTKKWDCYCSIDPRYLTT